MLTFEAVEEEVARQWRYSEASPTAVQKLRGKYYLCKVRALSRPRSRGSLVLVFAWRALPFHWFVWRTSERRGKASFGRLSGKYLHGISNPLSN